MAFAGIPVMKLPTPSTVKSQRARARKLLQERQKHTLLGLLLTVYVMLLMKNALLR